MICFCYRLVLTSPKGNTLIRRLPNNGSEMGVK